MRRLNPMLILAAVFIAEAATGAAATSTQAPQSCTGLSANLLRALEANHFAAATAHFDVRMLSALSPAKLRHIWENVLPRQAGGFEHAASAHETGNNGHRVIVTPLKFANGWLDMLVACDDQHRIRGLFFRPAQAPAPMTRRTPASASAWVAAAAAGSRTLQVAVPRGGFALKGVLDLPPGKGPFGVVDIIPGSGPVNINGNAGPIQYGPYKKLAATLIKAGWAVARVAKRGMPPSTGLATANRMVFKDQVADNLAVVEALRKNAHINPDRIVAAGHSLGGLIAPKLATETKLAGLILLEAPGENMARIVTAQTLRQQKLAGAGATELAVIKAQTEKLNSLVARAPPGQTVAYGTGSSLFARIFSRSPGAVQLFKSWYAQEPLQTARKVTIPVLVVQGGKDTQVFPDNGKQLAKALPHGKLLYLPKMDHDLSLQQEGIGKGARLAPGLAAGIVRWLRTLKP